MQNLNKSGNKIVDEWIIRYFHKKPNDIRSFIKQNAMKTMKNDFSRMPDSETIKRNEGSNKSNFSMIMPSKHLAMDRAAVEIARELGEKQKRLIQKIFPIGE